MTGRVTRVSGPLVEVRGLDGAAVADVVEVGPDRLVGEIVAMAGDRSTAQVYEYTGGLAPGATVVGTGAPLAVRLGPGLLGGVFDGILRPLADAGEWLGPAQADRRGTSARRVSFSGTAALGDPVAGGCRIGTATDDDGTVEAVVVPPGVSGTVERLRPDGDMDVDDVVARVGGRDVAAVHRWPVRRPRPHAGRLESAVPLRTGQRVLDILLPVARGSTAAVVGGFGTGKTVLLQQVAKWSEADVIVYVGCGERGNELADAVDELRSLTDPRSGRRLSERTVIVANTSNMPVMAREASIYTGITVAEYFRDQGLDVVLIADSTSRWAEALRELSSAGGEIPAEEGFPAGLASALAAFYERAGRVRTLAGGVGSVTVVAAVSPPGGDVAEPVSAHTQRFVRVLWTLDRDLAYARHYPAVSWRSSFSRDAADLGAWYTGHGDPGWPGRRARLQTVLAEADRLQSVAELVGTAALPGRERVVLLTARLVREAVLQQSATSADDATCGPAKQRALAEAVLAVHDRAQALVVRGRPATFLEAVDYSPLLRAGPDVGSDDADDVVARRDVVLAALEAAT